METKEDTDSLKLSTRKSRRIPFEKLTEIQYFIDGSSSNIYKAIYKKRAVMVKILRPELAHLPLRISEYDIEESVLDEMDHSNIIKIIGHGFNPLPFIVVEYLANGTLAEKMRKNKIEKKSFTYLEVLNIAKGLAAALNYLHNDWRADCHCIHRDIKPDNIGWTDKGILRLFDFGLCTKVGIRKQKSDCYELTGKTGTKGYMAPEVALDEPYNQSVDVFSFAIIVWQVMTGKSPYEGMDKQAYIDKVVREKFRNKLESHWPLRLKNLLKQCWHHKPSRRPDISYIVDEVDALIEEAERSTLFPGILGEQFCMESLFSIFQICTPPTTKKMMKAP